MPYEPITNFKDSNGVDLGKKLVTKDYLLEVYGTILESSGATGLVVTPELWVWGMGNDGRLGTNNTATAGTPVTTFAGGTTWKSVSAGRSYTAAIKTDGSLWTWGQNSNGQLGDNTTTSRSTPVTTFAGGNDWKHVDCGWYNTAAIKTDGSLWIWGYNGNGQLGDFSTTQRNIPVTTFSGGNNWKQVSCGEEYTAAIKTDGSLWVFGRNNNTQLGINNTDQKNTPVTTFAGGTTWKSVACGRTHAAAIKTDGSLWVWGRNNEGQLGVNTANNVSTPVTTFAGGNTWKSAAGGDFNTAAIKTDGSLWTWGLNNYAQLGINGATNRSTPVTTFAGGTNWKQVNCGYYHTTAIKTDGSLWVWGRNDLGQLGINQGDANRSTPVTTFAGGTNWKQVSANDRHTAAIQTIDYI